MIRKFEYGKSRIHAGGMSTRSNDQSAAVPAAKYIRRNLHHE
jgi:hypothetical protein